MLHFISGLPRSGSTLLCNLLAQNPRFHTTGTSGCLDVLFGLRNSWDQQIEHRSSPNDDAKRRVLRAAMDAYHGSPRAVTFDKSRGWLAHLELAEELLGRRAKVLVPVRPLEEILSSFERLHRKTARIKQPPYEAEFYVRMQTQLGRCETWCDDKHVVGIAFNRVLDAIRRGFADRMLFIRFDDLTGNPLQTLSDIHDFLGEKPFAYNPEHVQQVTTEDDSLHGYVGLHDIRSKIEPVEPSAMRVLGAAIAQQYRSMDRINQFLSPPQPAAQPTEV